MNASSMFKALCLPSKIYLVLSFIAILYSIIVPDVMGGVSAFAHVFHMIYVLFWTWILQLICKEGYTWISWVLVLAPFVAAFIIVAFMFNDISAHR